MIPPPSSVAVCIATFRRPAGLRTLLQALGRLDFQKSERPAIFVYVVDNDPGSGEARQVCSQFEDGPYQLTYLSEPRVGISFARNAGVEHAIASKAEMIVFIDDDESPDPHWLDELLSTRHEYDAHVVAGPVLPLFQEGVPSWVIRGRFFDRPRMRTGTLVNWVGAGNLLVTSRLLTQVQGFDAGFAHTGGEDSELSLRLKNTGSTMVWSDEAIVREDVPVNRARARWILRRAFAGGNNWARIQITFRPGFQMRLVQTSRAVANVAAGTLMLLPSLFAGRHRLVRSGIRVCAGFGALSNLLGFRYKRYGCSKVE